MNTRTPLRLALLGLCVLSSAAMSRAQIIDPIFAGSYSFRDLGTPASVPGPLGGLTLQAGNVNSLLVGGGANGPSGAIYSVGLNRTILGDGLSHVTSFSGPGTQFATAPNIDGGLTYGPGGVLFATTFSNNQLLQYKPGSTAPDKIIDLNALGISSSTGTISFTPGGQAVIASYSASRFYGATFTPDGGGTYDFALTGSSVATSNGPEGILYVPSGSPVFSTLDPAASWMLLTEYGAGKITAYKSDASGLPIPLTGIDFMTNVPGAEGAALDPTTSDFLFSTFGGGNRVLAVSGFALVAIPEPGTLALALLGSLGLGIAGRRKKKRL